MDLGRMLVLVGLAVVGVGLVVMAASALGLGRLPGDFAYRGRNVRIYVPLASSILLSVLLTIVLNILARR